jgi:hypothetical protein
MPVLCRTWQKIRQLGMKKGDTLTVSMWLLAILSWPTIPATFFVFGAWWKASRWLDVFAGIAKGHSGDKNFTQCQFQIA